MNDMSRRTFIAASGAATAIPLLGAPSTAHAEPTTPSNSKNSTTTQRRYLFFDNYHVESATNVSRIVHAGESVSSPVTGTRTIMEYGDNPWEPTRVQLYGSVIYDETDARFKMWYRALLPNGEPRICYADSRDGLVWRKPALNIEEFDGSTRNNISIHMDMASVIHDLQEPDPSRRFKIFGVTKGGYSVAFSPDGKRWSDVQFVFKGDDTCSASWDPISQRFLATTKVQAERGRSVLLSTSTDFVTWTEPQLMMTGDDRGDYLAKASPLATNVALAREEIYACPIVSYQDLYVAMPWSFEYTGGNGVGGNADGMVRPQAAFSRDLTTWDRSDRTPLIDSGPSGSFDSGIIQGTATDIVVRNNKIWLYYSGFNTTHGGNRSLKRVAIGLVQWRLDGFASASNGGDAEGTIITKPVKVTGRHLRLNFDALSQIGRHGELRIELLDATGRALPWYSGNSAAALRGDDIDRAVKWPSRRDLTSLIGHSIKLRITLKGCDLYSFKFA